MPKHIKEQAPVPPRSPPTYDLLVSIVLDGIKFRKKKREKKQQQQVISK